MLSKITRILILIILYYLSLMSMHTFVLFLFSSQIQRTPTCLLLYTSYLLYIVQYITHSFQTHKQLYCYKIVPTFLAT